MRRTKNLIRWTKKKNSANTCQIQIKQGKLPVYGKLSIIYEQTIQAPMQSCLLANCKLPKRRKKCPHLRKLY